MTLMKSLTVTVLGVGLIAAIPGREAEAGSAGAFIGGVAVGAAGAVIGHKIYKHQKRKKARAYHQKQRYSSGRRSSGLSGAQRAENADIQNRLNLLSYDAGTLDGIMGRKTRSAIRSFQAANSRPVTGRLTNSDIALLYQQSEPLLAETAPAPQAKVAAAAATGAVAGGAVVASAAQEENATTASSQKAPKAVTNEFEETPRILGLAVKEDFSTALDTLKSEGFSDCQSSKTALLCEKATGFGDDKVSVASTSDKIHTITRSLSFKTPIDRTSVIERLPASYKPLLASDSKTIAASPACDALLTSKPDTLDHLAKASEAGEPFDAEATAFSHACKYYYTMDLSDDEKVKNIGIVFFDASPILASLGTDEKQPAKAGDELKF